MGQGWSCYTYLSSRLGCNGNGNGGTITQPPSHKLNWGEIWDNIVDWLNPFSANKWGGNTEESGSTGTTGMFEGVAKDLDWWNPFSENKGWFDIGGGDTNNNQEININISATGGSNGELAQTIRTEVAAAVQEIQTKGSPR